MGLGPGRDGRRARPRIEAGAHCACPFPHAQSCCSVPAAPVNSLPLARTALVAPPGWRRWSWQDPCVHPASSLGRARRLLQGRSTGQPRGTHGPQIFEWGTGRLQLQDELCLLHASLLSFKAVQHSELKHL